MNTFPSGAPPLPLRPGAITSDHTGGKLDAVRTAVMALQHFAEQTSDDQDLATVHACITNLQKLLAGHAKDRAAAMGMTPAMRTVKRSTAGY